MDSPGIHTQRRCRVIKTWKPYDLNSQLMSPLMGQGRDVSVTSRLQMNSHTFARSPEVHRYKLTLTPLHNHLKYTDIED